MAAQEEETARLDQPDPSSWPDGFPTIELKVKKLAIALHAIAYHATVCEFAHKTWDNTDEETQQNYILDAQEILRAYPNLLSEVERQTIESF